MAKLFNKHQNPDERRVANGFFAVACPFWFQQSSVSRLLTIDAGAICPVTEQKWHCLGNVWVTKSGNFKFHQAFVQSALKPIPELSFAEAIKSRRHLIPGGSKSIATQRMILGHSKPLTLKLSWHFPIIYLNCSVVLGNIFPQCQYHEAAIRLQNTFQLSCNIIEEPEIMLFGIRWERFMGNALKYGMSKILLHLSTLKIKIKPWWKEPPNIWPFYIHRHLHQYC